MSVFISDTESLRGRQERDNLLTEIVALREALEDALHDLETAEGLWATDQPNAFSEALSEGCDANGAWDLFREGLFELKFPIVAKIRAALARAEPEDMP